MLSLPSVPVSLLYSCVIGEVSIVFVCLNFNAFGNPQNKYSCLPQPTVAQLQFVFECELSTTSPRVHCWRQRIKLHLRTDKRQPIAVSLRPRLGSHKWRSSLDFVPRMRKRGFTTPVSHRESSHCRALQRSVLDAELTRGKIAESSPVKRKSLRLHLSQVTRSEITS